ncbi:MAG: T9SS type A sorting domain-containing protein [Cytophagales bacterium]|nr:T9SS type A sorting domain-containing protein [Cytophagales bacterium]
MRKTLLNLLAIGLFFPLWSQQVFINEIHYDNAGSDLNEGVEIAGPAGTDLSTYSLVAYNGNGGADYNTINLSGVISDQQNGFGTTFVAISGLQNGAPDGIALFDGTAVVQFLSYEGAFTGVGGVADGITSTDIGIAEDGGTAVGTSLQLAGQGIVFSDFTWESGTSTYDAVNNNQTLGNATPVVFINELHYDNASSDVNEGVELAGTAGTDLTGWTLQPYNGSNGTAYSATSLSGNFTDQDNGFGFIFFAISGLQNGAPDGVALVDDQGAVVQFLSYEGSFTATNGPASGLTSEDIGISETGSTPVGESLQLTGAGTAFADFTWTIAVSTYNALNDGQSFGSGGPDPDPDPATGIAFINEIHYDNSSTDVNEGVEIAGTAGLDLTGWTIQPYNGNGGAPYSATNLSGTIPDQQAGFGTILFAISGLQNGAPDGIALINGEGAVVEFLSYEGSFTAVGGAADGTTSTDIGVAETSSTPAGFSLQLTGTGSVSADFTWAAAATSTYDAINNGQTFVSPVPVVFINEIHYDNASTDVGEGVEIAGTAGTDLTGYTLEFYNGNGGAVYNVTNLSGTLPDQDNGFGTLSFAVAGIQNGAPDGVALSDPDGMLIEFLSYEGSFIGSGGNADGVTSTDIGVVETSSTPAGFSLQLTGTGSQAADFIWSAPIAATFDAINTGQSFGGVIEPPTPTSDTVTVAQARALPQGNAVVVLATLTAADQFGGPAYLQDSTAGIALFDSQVHGDGNFQIGDQLWITGAIGAFNNQIQLVNVDTAVLVGNSPVTPTAATVADLINLEGQLVTLDLTFDTQQGLLYPNSNYGTSDNTGAVDVRIDADVDLVGRLIPTGVTSVTGVVGRFQTSLQILPRFQSDIPDAGEFVPAGSDIPFNETLDIATWNMEFFGTTISNFGPSDITSQRDNAVTLIQNLNADIIAVQEVSEEAILDEALTMLPQYQRVCSPVFSRSFQAPDPNNPFPPQKLCYLYDTTVVDFVADRVVFDQFYTDARTGLISDLDDHPGSSGAQSFWSSGRLPYLLEVDATVNGVTERITLVNIHAKSGSSTNDLARRVYDNGVLKDTLDAMYGNDNLILLGDYNDDVDESIGGGPSSYQVFLDDTTNYNAPTGSLSLAGFRSFVFSDNMIDHIAISDELFDLAIDGSEQTFIPFNLIDNYANTTSDHLPVILRFDLGDPIPPLVVTSGEAQTVLAGYEPEATATLEVDIAGGLAPFSYAWSTGETTASINVTPDVTTTYTVTVSDGSGQVVNHEIVVNAKDVRCTKWGKPGVKMCFKGRDICVKEFAVEWFRSQGAIVGDCDCAENIEIVTTSVSVYPNPFLNELSISVEAGADSDLQITVTNFHGRQVLDETVSVVVGDNPFTFDLTGERRGYYVLRVINPSTGVVEKVKRLIKRR